MINILIADDHEFLIVGGFFKWQTYRRIQTWRRSEIRYAGSGLTNAFLK
jgi:hypothetical protein